MSLSNEQITRLQECRDRFKKVNENYDEKFKLYLDEQLQESKKIDSSITAFDAEEMDDLRIAFQEIQAEKGAKELYAELPFTDLMPILGLAISAYPDLVSAPIIFGAVNFLFEKLGFFGNQERFLKQIMEAVEQLIDKKISDERRRQCNIKFQQLQKTGDEYFFMAEEYFKRNGKKNVDDSLISNEIKSMPNETLLSSLQIQLMIYRNQITDGLVYFEEESELINTIGFYILTAAQYLCIQRDCAIYGKEWGFSDFDVNDAKSRLHSKSIEFIQKVIKCGWILSRHYYGELAPSFGYVLPPYFDAARVFKNADPTYYPVRALSYSRNPPNITYEVDGSTGSHLLGPNILRNWTFMSNSLTSGFRAIKAAIKNEPNTLIVKFPSAKSRTFKVKFHHQIVYEADWTIKAGNVVENFVFKEGSETEKRNAYLVYYENFDGPQSYGVNVTKAITVTTQEVTFTSNRSYGTGYKHGYAGGSILYLIEIIFD
ncbi:hypothetical protein DICPUDRAFT_47080 [Dictyostelium purpureum]|uniref:Pesticidal crystal protein domain-containing protein n=1 Tax=Dictyostelium purpureum TaxID=5786 RepID=F0ZHS1_DICPU|nr:uncharacterized protein DICPUDRAFT_47080 [Dictyostelium purpureum]EGC36512.1 hypothetical protein DICPUDRAFT_47080 [Dictyostelium purpureum]|eukprot:XP_003286957.1 hypothetical protein DICPUDRAFT_47080 [Dictyostelium purpureum]